MQKVPEKIIDRLNNQLKRKITGQMDEMKTEILVYKYL
jgi:hypothetical protein